MNVSKLILILGVVMLITISMSAWAANLIVNGDFESGNVGFSTDFTYSPGDIWDPATYAILKDPSSSHPLAYSFGGRGGGTSGIDDHMMAVNGTTDATKNLVWSQTVPKIDTNFDFYKLSIWVATWEKAQIPGLLDLFINDKLIRSATKSPETLGRWVEYTFLWKPTLQDSFAKIDILNTSTDYVGNDFALDDISFRGVPIPQTVWLLGSCLLILIGFKRKNSKTV